MRGRFLELSEPPWPKRTKLKKKHSFHKIASFEALDWVAGNWQIYSHLLPCTLHKGLCAFINSNRTQPAFIKSYLTREKFPTIFVIQTYIEPRNIFMEYRTLSQLNDTNGIQMLAKFKSGIKHFFL